MNPALRADVNINCHHLQIPEGQTLFLKVRGIILIIHLTIQTTTLAFNVAVVRLELYTGTALASGETLVWNSFRQRKFVWIRNNLVSFMDNSDVTPISFDRPSNDNHGHAFPKILQTGALHGEVVFCATRSKT
jgi:hypothetical protein